MSILQKWHFGSTNVGILVAVVVFVSAVETNTVKKVEIVRMRSRILPMTVEWLDPVGYVDNVTSSLMRKLKDYGVCNLPVSNKAYNFNAARPSNHPLGSLTYTDGVVVRIKDIKRWPAKVTKLTENGETILKFRLCVENITIVYELRANHDLSTTSILTFPTIYIEIMISYNIADDKTGVKSMKTISVSPPKMTYIPDSIIMTSASYNSRQSMSASLFTDVTSWIQHILQPMVENIVREAPFSMKVKRAKKRRPTTRALCCQRNRDKLTGIPRQLQGQARHERKLCCKRHRAMTGLLRSGVEKHREQTKLTSKWDEPLEYMDDIIQLFGQRLKGFGVENLPVADKFYKINTTRYNIHLMGDTKYTNGYVIDIQNISRHVSRIEPIWYIKDNLAIMQYRIRLAGVQVLYDFNAELEVANLMGTAELGFLENAIEVNLFYNISTKEVGVTSMTTYSVQGPLTIFSPDSDVMRALAYNGKLTLSSSLFSDMSIWINKTLKGLLQDVVQELPFPLQFMPEHS